MFKVKCPVCNDTREVEAKKPWMIGEEPFVKLCRKHSGDKSKSPEHRKKLSDAIKNLQTDELLQKKKQFMLDHPELWVVPRIDLAHQAWTGQHHTEESKKLISENVKKAKALKKEKNNEQRPI